MQNYWSFYQMPVHQLLHWEEHIRKLQYMFIIDGNTNCYSLQISLKMNLAMNEFIFNKNTDTAMPMNTTFIIGWIMFKMFVSDVVSAEFLVNI